MPRTIATGFGLGLLPYAPGTWGSALALPLAWIAAPAGMAVSLLGAALLTVLGTWSVACALADSAVADPPEIVIDEVCAQWLVLALLPRQPLAYILGFAAFRVVDVVKPWPAGWVDRHVPGALGVMADDLLAAPYAVAGTWLLLWAIGR
ncbi:MAG: phosphatidylglycerophosphatase A [Alphaproteobacteria bacterium]|nr:phosphatidylglycerophosphatase A [Alphaproteobacteria bacterium]